MSGGSSQRLRQLTVRGGSAGVLLLATYVLLSLLLDPGGYLGTDTGTKVYTLEVMDRADTFSPDIGYWAEEYDPSGSLHPVHQTRRQPDGSWVGVTTLPMLLAARPLYEWGGYPAALLLPMLGGVAAAFGARQVVRTLADADGGWRAFWVVGLGSPVVVYSLDLWEHSLGVATVVWATALLLRARHASTVWFALGAGVLLGAGAVMRQEILVYTLVMTVAFCILALLETRRLSRPLFVGAGISVGFILSWFGNQLLESTVRGQSRAARSASTAEAVVTGSFGGGPQSRVGERVEEGVLTFVGLVAGDVVVSVLLGLAIVAAVLAALRSEGRGDRTFARFALIALAGVYLADAIGNLGFVPGLLPAFPLAIGGLTAWRTAGRTRLLLVVALAALPMVYSFQFLGAAEAQWGGRYTLSSGLLLGLLALVVLRTSHPVVTRGLIMLSVLTAGISVAWLSQRSHDVDGFFEELVAEAEPLVIARQAFLLREGGAASVGRRWLSPESEAEFSRAVDIARMVGEEQFTVLEWDGAAPPEESLPDDVLEIRRETLKFISTPVGVVTYEFVD